MARTTTSKTLEGTGRQGAPLTSPISQIERQFGKGSIMKLGDRQNDRRPGAISTTSLSVDYALGVGGVPAAG